MRIPFQSPGLGIVASLHMELVKVVNGSRMFGDMAKIWGRCQPRRTLSCCGWEDLMWKCILAKTSPANSVIRTFNTLVKDDDLFKWNFLCKYGGRPKDSSNNCDMFCYFVPCKNVGLVTITM